MLNNICLGTSFSPEYCEGLGSENPLSLLKIVHTNLGINDIRLGLRWNRVENNGQLSLQYYEKYLEYLLKSKSKVCLNVGPIKVFRWPEEHIPDDLEGKKVKLLKPDDELAKYSYEYLHKVLSLLRSSYGDELKNVSFQLENEGFNRFGHLGIVMSQEYMVNLFDVLHSYFPDSGLMINSAGRRDLKKVTSLIKTVSEKGIYSPNSFTVGLNYYFRIPDTLPLFKRIEPIKYSFPGDMSIKRLHSVQKEMNFELEISEGQFEPWGVQRSPGNSYEDYKYLLEKSSCYFPDNYPYKLIRLWGTEELAMKVYSNKVETEHEKILESMKEYTKYM